MKLSTRGRYGLRAMIDLAIHDEGEYVSLGSIAQRQRISLNYLEHSFAALKHAGLVRGMSGSQGGYRLAVPANAVSIRQVLEVLEGDLSIVGPGQGKEESPYARVVRRLVWDRMDEEMDGVLSGLTLEDLAQEFARLQKRVDK